MVYDVASTTMKNSEEVSCVSAKAILDKSYVSPGYIFYTQLDMASLSSFDFLTYRCILTQYSKVIRATPTLVLPILYFYLPLVVNSGSLQFSVVLNYAYILKRYTHVLLKVASPHALEC